MALRTSARTRLPAPVIAYVSRSDDEAEPRVASSTYSIDISGRFPRALARARSCSP
jgi:hypothetical protein